MNDKPEKKIEYITPLKRICMTIGELPSSYLETMTYYEMLVWFTKFLQEKVIPTIDNNAEAVKELQQLFIELQNYVNNYFDNLDVQDEINNKLDDMVEQGTLQEIIADYLNSKAVFGFDNVASMKTATNLLDGSYAKTLGYYAKNDGGSGLYKIRNVTNDDVVDEAFIIEMSDNNLVAELIIENEVNIKTLGARSQDKLNNKYDIKTYIEKYITYIANNTNRCRLYIPAGIWYCSPLEITNPKGFDIYGDFGYYEYLMDSTVITSLNNNQPYILKLGTNTGTYLKNWNLENIIFSSYDYTYRSEEKDFYISTNKKITEQAINMIYAIHGKMTNILFINLIGQAIRMAGCWENKFDYLVFRCVSKPDGSIICFDTDNTYGQYSSISSSDFTELYFEKTHGDLMEFKNHCNFGNNHIGTINFEPNEFNYDESFTYTLINHDGSNIPEGLKHYYILNLSEEASNMVGNKIESIELNGFAQRMVTYNSNTYTYDTILKTPNNRFYLGLIIDSINTTETRKDIIIYKNESSNTPTTGCFLIINAVGGYMQHDFIFDLENAFSNIKCNGFFGAYDKLVTKLNNNITPFIDMLSPVQNNPIVSDNESINPLKLCCKLRRYESNLINGKIINTGTKMKVRCKVPNGETYVFRLENEDRSHSQNNSFVGTGNFEWYNIDLNQYLNTFGQIITFKTAGAANPDNCLLDCFMFVD